MLHRWVARAWADGEHGEEGESAGPAPWVGQCAAWGIPYGVIAHGIGVSD